MVMTDGLGWPGLVFLFALGLSTTAFASAIGLAGGALVSPVLILALGLKPRVAVGTTVVGVFAAVLSASLAYLRQKRVDVKLALLFDALDVVGVVLGAYLTTVLRPELLAAILGAFLVFSGARVMAKAIRELGEKGASRGRNSPAKREAGRRGRPGYRLGVRELTIAVLGSLFSGLASGLLGLGGGVVDLSLMLLIGVPMEVAAPTAMFGMLITRGSSVVAHVLMGNVKVELAIPLAAGAFIGGQVGPRLFKRARPEHLKLAFSCVALALGSSLLLKSLTELLRTC